MSFQFDHFIHVVNSPEKAIEQFTSVGLHAVSGGRHENHGTYNALTYFNSLSYVELLGIFDRSLVEKASEQKHSLRDTIVRNDYKEGTTRIAFRTKNIVGVAKTFKEAGLEVFGPIDFSRKRPDGGLVTWKLLFAGKEGQYPELPFFIQWDETDEERLASLSEQGTIGDHAIGRTKLLSVGITCKNIEATVKKWSRLLQHRVGESFIDDSLNAKAQTLIVPGGNINFYEPLGDGKVQEVLDNHGEKPFLLEIENEQKNEDIKLFDVIYRFKKNNN